MKEYLKQVIRAFHKKVSKVGTPYVVPNVIDKNTSIRYEILTNNANDIENAARVLAETFSQGEPMTLKLGLTIEDMLPFTTAVCQQAAKLALSIVAKAENGNVVGVLISNDITTPDPELDEKTILKLGPILALLEKIDEKLEFNTETPKGKHLHQFMIGVNSNPQWKGKNISNLLVYLDLVLGEAKGFVDCIAEVTGPISQHIYQKIGFQSLYSLSYDSFIYNQTKVFADIDINFQNSTRSGSPCENCQLVAGDISTLLAPIYVAQKAQDNNNNDPRWQAKILPKEKQDECEKGFEKRTNDDSTSSSHMLADNCNSLFNNNCNNNNNNNDEKKPLSQTHRPFGEPNAVEEQRSVLAKREIN